MALSSSSSGSNLAPPLQPSSTLVNVADQAESQLLQLCQLDAGSASDDVVRRIITDPNAMSTLVNRNPPEEALSAFYLLASMNSDMDTDALLQAVVKTDAPPTRKLALLAALYNVRADTYRTRILTQMMHLAASVESPQSLLVHLLAAGGNTSNNAMTNAEALHERMELWQVPTADRRELYRAAVAAAPAGKQKQELLVLLLGSYKTKADLDKHALAPAKEAALGAIRDPVTLLKGYHNLRTLPAMMALKDHKETKPLYDLVTVFCQGTLADFDKLDLSLYEPYGIAPDECLNHLRLLTLCSLAASNDELTYAEIAKALQVDSVEPWIISAVSSGLVQAKMDQANQTVRVANCVSRQLDWKDLQSKLHSWKQHVHAVVATIKAQQQQTQPM